MSKTNEILFIDTETGGLNPESFSIISFAGVLWRDGEILDSLQVFIQEEPFYSDVDSMKINRIDMDWIKNNGLPPSKAVKQITDFLKQIQPNSVVPMRLGGHNIGFDVGFTKRLFRLGGGDFSSFFSHRTIDTSTILAFLSLANKIKLDGAGSSDAFSHFGIEFAQGDRHTALGDALATAKLFNCLLDVVE